MFTSSCVQIEVMELETKVSNNTLILPTETKLLDTSIKTSTQSPIQPTPTSTFTKQSVLPTKEPSRTEILATATLIPPTITNTPTITPIIEIEFFDFEDQDSTIPNGFSKRVGAFIGSGKNNIIELDNAKAHSGEKSLKISSNDKTIVWNSVAKQIPTDLQSVVVSYYVKGNNILREGDQFDNCYVGFMSKDNKGNKEFHTNSYKDLYTFDWTYGEIQLIPEKLQYLRDNGFNVELLIFCSVSGEFWIDDLQIMYIYPNQE